jgi:cobalt-zinc-cadmium efflux system outer membrane protein
MHRQCLLNLNLQYIFICSLLFIMILTPFAGFSQAKEDILNLDQLIKMTIDRNPQLHSFYSATLADSARIPQSGSLPDPTLSFNLLNAPINSFAFDQEPMTGKQISLRQMFPFPGKLSIKEKISSEVAAISITKYQEYKNQIIKDLKTAYYNLFFIDKAIEITNKNQILLQEFAKIAETKYSVGKGLQQDVLKAQVELSKTKDKLIQLEQKREVIQAKINTIINEPVNSKLGKTDEPDFFFINQNLDTLQSIAITNRPLLQGWESMKRQSNLKVALAKKDYWPDFSLFLAYNQREELLNGNPGYDFLSGGISLNIPIYSGRKQSKRVEETQFFKNMIDERYTQILNQVYFELENKRSSAGKNAKLVELFKTEIIPQASQSVESALMGYQTDKVDFLTLINNQITLFNYELDYFRVFSDYNKDIANLEFLTGRQLK